jgi:hypothetical protein
VCLGAGLTTEEWSLELCGNFRGRGSGVLSCKLFFSFFLQLVVSVFVDSERALFLTGYGTHGYCLVSSELPFSGQLVAAGL